MSPSLPWVTVHVQLAKFISHGLTVALFPPELGDGAPFASLSDSVFWLLLNPPISPETETPVSHSHFNVSSFS